jgi:hypothetical protein
MRYINKLGALCLLPLAFACNKPKSNSGNNGNGTSNNKLANANLNGAKSLFIAKSQGRDANASKLYKLVEENGTYKHVEVSFTDAIGQVVSSNVNVNNIFNLEKGFILLTLDNSSTGGNLLFVNKTTGDIFAVPGYYNLSPFDEQPIKTIPNVATIYFKDMNDVVRIDYANPSNPTVEKILSNKGILSGVTESLSYFHADKHGNIFYKFGYNLRGLAWKAGGSKRTDYDVISREFDEEFFYVQKTRVVETTFNDGIGNMITKQGKAIDFVVIDGSTKNEVAKTTVICPNDAEYTEIPNMSSWSSPATVPKLTCSKFKIAGFSHYDEQKYIKIKNKNAIVLYAEGDITPMWNEDKFPVFVALVKKGDKYELEEIPVQANTTVIDNNSLSVKVADEENGLLWQLDKTTFKVKNYFFDIDNKKITKKETNITANLTLVYGITLMNNKTVQVTGLLSDKDARVIIEFDENLNQKIISEIELNAEIVNLIKLN